ncbi:hypothetical protein [Paucibacter soli]|uniref:hypothetical protein n=1 Tax=Paucibacter soli TaxID=3133433 RepID=UPI0030948A41
MHLRDYFDLTKAEDRQLLQLEKQMREASAWLDEPAIFQLPHPGRVLASPSTAPAMTMMTLAEPKNQSKVTAWLDKGLATIDIFKGLDDLDDKRIHIFHALHRGTAEATGGFGAGTAGPMVQALRFQQCGGRIYSFSNELVQLLGKTKIGTEVPISELKLPSPNIYIELGTDRNAAPMNLEHAQSGFHPLEGAYVSAVVDGEGRQVLEITLTGSPVGRDDVMDDVVEWAAMKCDDGVSIEAALTVAYTQPAHDSLEQSGYFDDQEKLHGQARAASPQLELLAKCILFLGLPEAMKKEFLERTEAKKVLLRAQSGAHKRKAGRTVARSYDRIMVDAPPAPATSSTVTDGEHRTVKTHWRDGHFRHQRHGPGLSLTKVIWMRPMLINADAIAAS